MAQPGKPDPSGPDVPPVDPPQVPNPNEQPDIPLPGKDLPSSPDRDLPQEIPPTPGPDIAPGTPNGPGVVM